ncbi:NUDIX hydrolase [Oceanobacillus sp. FSL H7-0719]|uniref:NUDIX hydrolase n=1 Tax=Oceanobacillus sp. FSL H7-0719 TaxID=2954507 RepID=UPI00324C20D5
MDASRILAKLEGRAPSIMGQQRYKQSAVLLPLLNIQDETHVLFEVRSMQMRSQPGDICFPGGRIDKTDKSPKETAIRETMEELGISASNIEAVTPLDYIVNDSGRIIYPFVGKLLNYEQIKLNEAEVSEVFTVPLSYFLETEPEVYKVHFQVNPEKDFPFDLIVGGKDYKWNTGHIDELFYQYNGKVIWGLTAKILTHFVHLLKK